MASSFYLSSPAELNLGMRVRKRRRNQRESPPPDSDPFTALDPEKNYASLSSPIRSCASGVEASESITDCSRVFDVVMEFVGRRLTIARSSVFGTRNEKLEIAPAPQTVIDK